MEYAIGVDIGGTKIQFALVDRHGSIIHRHLEPTEAQAGPQQVMDKVLNRIDRLISMQSTNRISGIGIGSAGQIEACTGSVKYAGDTVPGWTGTPLKRLVEERQLGAGVDTVPCLMNALPLLPVSARYVKLEVTSAANKWSLIDEWEVIRPTGLASAILNGSFLQPQLADQWSNAQWATEFQKMDEVGIDHLIVQWTADSSADQVKKYRLTDLNGVTGRYFKVQVAPASSAWTFVDEIQARN